MRVAVLVAIEPCFLRGDLHGVLAARRVVRADLGADAILQRGDDLASRRVVLRVCREDHQQVERQADGVSLDLDVAFLEDVEQADLNLAREVGQLVDAEDAAVGTRQEAVMNRELVGQLQPAARRLDRIDVAEHVGDRHVWRRELFDVARVARQPRDIGVVAFGRDPHAARRADRIERIVMDLASRHDRQMLVEQRRQRAQNPALGLPAQAEQDEVVPRQHRVHELRDNGIVVTDDAGKQRVAAAEFRDEVVAHFVLHRAARKRLRRRCAGAAKTAERLDGRDRWHVAILSQLESRGASRDPFFAPPRVCASRRQQDWPGKHD